MKREQVIFICGVFAGLIFNWSNTLFAFALCYITCSYFVEKKKIQPESETTEITKRKKRKTKSIGSTDTEEESQSPLPFTIGNTMQMLQKSNITSIVAEIFEND